MIAKKYQKELEALIELFPVLSDTQKVVSVLGCPIYVLENNKAVALKNYWDYEKKLKDIQIKIFKNIKECRDFLTNKSNEQVENEFRKIKDELKGAKFLEPIGFTQFFQVDKDWYKAINCSVGFGWDVVEGVFAVPKGFLPFPMRCGDVYRNIQILDIKDSKDFFHNPLMKIKILNEDEANLQKRIQENFP